MVHKFNYSQADINTRVANISNYSSSIDTIGRQLNVEPALLKAVIAVESSGNARAGEGRTTGAKGLMQIIDQTWRSTVQNFANVNYKGTPLSSFVERDANDAWADPGLNILIGTLTLILKARSLTKMTGITVSTDDPADSILLLTSYNAGEFTVAQAYKHAVNGGSKNPEQDFVDQPYLKQAIQDVVTKFNLSWNIDAKYKEMSEYAGRVLTFLELFRGTSTYTKPTVAVATTNTTTTIVHKETNTNTTAYTVVVGDSGYKIAAKLGVSFGDLGKANPSVDWTKLKLGQQINIPGKANFTKPVQTEPVKPQTAQQYRVQKGETPSIIANRFGTTPAALKAANPAQWKRWPNGAEGFDAGAVITIPV